MASGTVRVYDSVRLGLMTVFGPGTYGDSFADVYDQWYGQITDAEATADFVSSRCLGGPILELGVGTGRLAVPLVERGHQVIGLDASMSMLSQCPESVGNVLGDMAALPFGPKAFGAALCAFNTLFNLTSAQDQQLFFHQVAASLAPGAPLIIETFTGVGLDKSEQSSLGVSRIDADRLVLAATLVDTQAQTITGQHVDITETGIKLRPWLIRWATPHQLDEFASAAGLQLADRYSSWKQDEFDPGRDLAISVYTEG